MSNMPPFPKIDGHHDLLLDVYTHKSLRFSGAPLNEEYGDTDRLAILGEKVLDLAVTSYLFSRKPILLATEIDIKRAEVISDANLEHWLGGYKLQNVLRFAPDESETIDSPQEIRQFFHTYVGALFIRNGMPTIQTWITRLIDPDADIPPPPGPGTSSQTHEYGQQGWGSPAPPSASPPPLPSFGSSPNGGGGGSLVTLALVNQTASQRGVAVSYPAEQTGPPHQPTWTVRCCMNGIERGCGVGKSQKVAKEEAARQAFVSMGWGPRA